MQLEAVHSFFKSTPWYSLPFFVLLVYFAHPSLSRMGLPPAQWYWFNHTVEMIIPLVLLCDVLLLLRSMKRYRAGWLMAGFMLLSCFWSLLPPASFALWQGVAGAFAFGIILGSRLRPFTVLGLFVVLFLFLAIPSFIVGMWFPFYGHYEAPEREEYWIGVYGDNNYLAFYMNMALATFLALWRRGSPPWVRYCILLPLMAMTCTTILYSLSATGVLCVLALVAAVALARIVKRYDRRVPFGDAALLACIALAAGISAEPRVAGWIGRDPTLTGRTKVWQYFLQAAAHRPLLGYGAQNIYVLPVPDVPEAVFYDWLGTPHALTCNSLYYETDLTGLLAEAELLAGKPMLRSSFAHALRMEPVTAFGSGVIYVHTSEVDSSPLRHRGMPYLLTQKNLYYETDLRPLMGPVPAPARSVFYRSVLNAAHLYPLTGFNGQELYRQSEAELLTHAFYKASGSAYAVLPHNLYIAVFVKYGLAGSALFLYFFTALWAKAIRAYRLQAGILPYWVLLMLAVITFYGFALTIDDTQMVWLLFGVISALPLAAGRDGKVGVC